jgi:Endosomal/lysosomal potassium channel TMEM175
VQGRQHEVSRLEGFSDAVFGFALTLLVVSLDVPDTVEELKLLVRGSVPFALMFAMVCCIWWEHNKFFRRFGLQDAWRQREALQLDRSELVTLRFGLQAQLISTGLAILSIALTFVMKEEMMWVPGVLYGLMGPLHGTNGYFAGVAHAKLKTRSPV